MTDNLIPEEYLIPNPRFVVEHLRCPKELQVMADDEELRRLVDDYQARKGDQYLDLAKVLNHLSRYVHNGIKKKKELIIFVDHHSVFPKHHPNGFYDCAPDLLGMPASIVETHDYLQGRCKFAEWSDIETLAEIKTVSDLSVGPGQLSAYLGLANQARPDKAGMHGVTLSPVGYQVQYSDAAGLVSSEYFTWSNLLPLAGYIFTLYCPRSDHSMRDPTITRSKIRDSKGKPTWDVEFDGETYPACSVKVVGSPWSRMTWVAQTAGEYPIVIKDSYWSTGRTFKEGELYEILANDKPTPGFVRVIAAGDVMNGNFFVGTMQLHGEPRRVKTRIVMTTSGEPLHRSPSVRHFLMAMYDVLESHRWAVKRRNILHRDISQANIIIHPKDPTDKYLDEEGRPIFINEVLDNKQAHASPVAELVDLDNSAEYDRTIAQSLNFQRSLLGPLIGDHLRRRTGTPRFIARAVCKGELLRRLFTSYCQMPRLESKALELYKAVHDGIVDPIRLLEDDNTFHGMRFSGNSSQQEVFQHHPRHDAESVYWVMVAFVLRAKPLGATGDKHNHRLNKAWASLALHHITSSCGSGTVETRAALFVSESAWAQWLHEGLACLAPLMAELGEQVEPEYGYLQPTDPYHLHEAMQRILLKYIVQIEDVPLDVDELRSIEERPVPRPRVTTAPSPNGQNLILSVSSSALKRKSVAGTRESQSKRQKRSFDPLILGPFPTHSVPSRHASHSSSKSDSLAEGYARLNEMMSGSVSPGLSDDEDEFISDLRLAGAKL